MAHPKSDRPNPSRDRFLIVVDFLFYLFIASLPLLIHVFFIASQKIYIPEIIFLILTFSYGIAIVLKKREFRWHNVFWVFIFYFSASLFSAFLSENMTQSFFKLLGISYLIGLSVVVYNFVQDISKLKKFCRAWLIGTIIVILIGLFSIVLFYVSPQNPILDLTISHYGAVPVGNYPRVMSTLYSSSLLCNYLILSLGILYISERSGWVKNQIFLPLLFFILVISAFTISSGLGGVALIFGFWVWLVFKNRNKIISKLFLFGGMFSAFFFFALSFFALESYKNVPYSIRLPVIEKTIYPSSRLLVWTDSFETFLQNPLSGVGIGLPSCVVYFQNTDGTVSILTDAHNIYISLASQAGFPGLIALLILIYFLIREIYPFSKNGNNLKTIRIFLLLTLISGFIYQGVFGSFEDARHVWVLFGLILAFGKTEESKNCI